MPKEEGKNREKGAASPARLCFYGRLFVCGDLVPVTDTRVGGDELTVGLQFYAPDNPIVRNARGEPFIPGSTLKGVMRNSLDLLFHREEVRRLTPNASKKQYGAVTCEKKDCWVCRIFGRPANQPLREPTRLRVEDALLDPDSLQELGFESPRDLSLVRTENAILRLFGAANPRRSEYVPAGVRFKMRLIYEVYLPEDVDQGLPVLLTALHHLEDAGLGGGRSRGTGKVRFENLQLFWKSVDHYREGDRVGQCLVDAVNGAAEFQKACREPLKDLANNLRAQESKAANKG